MSEVTKLIHKYLRHEKKFPTSGVRGAATASSWGR